MHPTRNDLPAKTRRTIIDLCNANLADLVDLQSQLKQAHWNVKGPGFHALHELLDEIAELVEGFADEVAERATSLGGVALGTVRMAAKGSRLPEYGPGIVNQKRTLATVADRLAAVAKTIRKGIESADKAGDAGTADLFTDVSRGLDKNLWFIESHLLGDR